METPGQELFAEEQGSQVKFVIIKYKMSKEHLRKDGQ